MKEMKITCGVEISNRAHPAVSLRNHTNYRNATLALCYKSNQKEVKNNKGVLLVLCTHRNSRGTKYKIFDNVEILINSSNNGKSTLRFQNPPHDLIISKANPIQLKKLLCGVTEGIHTKIPIKPKASIRQHTSSRTCKLESCSLNEVDNRIMRLQNLQKLDLGHCKLEEVPVALADKPLKELILHHNALKSFPQELALSTLGQSLSVLDLSFNELKDLVPHVCCMKKLSVLNLTFNDIVRLPRNIQSFESLQVLSASHNKIEVLPFGLTKLKLKILDLYGNPLSGKVVMCPEKLPDISSLRDKTADCIVANSIPFSYGEIPATCCDYLIEFCTCTCGTRVFQDVSSCIMVLELYNLAEVVVCSQNGSRFKVPTQVYFCSTKCWKKFYHYTEN